MNETFSLGIAGLGTVGTATIKLIQNNIDEISEKSGKKIIIKAVSAKDISKDRVHNHLIPGHGVINFEKIFENLEKIRYKGFITIELYPYLKQPEKAASEALNHLKSMM